MYFYVIWIKSDPLSMLCQQCVTPNGNPYYLDKKVQLEKEPFKTHLLNVPLMTTKLRIYVVLSNTPASLNLLLVMSIKFFRTSPWMVCFRRRFVNCCESCTQLIKMLPWILLSKDGCSHLGHCHFNIQLMEFIDRLQW